MGQAAPNVRPSVQAYGIKAIRPRPAAHGPLPRWIDGGLRRCALRPGCRCDRQRPARLTSASRSSRASRYGKGLLPRRLLDDGRSARQRHYTQPARASRPLRAPAGPSRGAGGSVGRRRRHRPRVPAPTPAVPAARPGGVDGPGGGLSQEQPAQSRGRLLERSPFASLNREATAFALGRAAALTPVTDW